VKKILLLTAIIVSGGFISCNKNIEDETSTYKREVKFSSNIVNIVKPATRAAGQTWHTADSIGIYMFDSNVNDVVENRDNVKYINTIDGATGKFNPDSEIIFFPDDGSDVVFMSYYPFNKDITDKIYPVNVAVQTSLPAIDLLYSFDKDKQFNKATENKLVTLVFDHQLTKININVKPGEELPEDYLDNLTVHFEGLNTTADFNLMTGVLSSLGNTADISTLETTPVDGYSVSFEAIVIPADPTNAKIVFDLNNGDDSDDDMFSWIFKDKTFVKGTEYNYNVTIKRSGIVVEATINPWIKGDESNIDAE